MAENLFAQQGLESLWKIAGLGSQTDPRSGHVPCLAFTLQTKPRVRIITTHGQRTGREQVHGQQSCVQPQPQTHQVKRFKALPLTPSFLETDRRGVSLCLNPPQQAVVLCVDEKSQIQALDRTQPGLPLKKGRCGTMTHDYKRHGTTTLFAALELAQGKVVGQCQQRHRNPKSSEVPAHLGPGSFESASTLWY